MEISSRLLVIQKQIATLRRKGHVRTFPEELKREALELCDLVGVSCVAQESGLTKPVLYTWSKETPPSREDPLAPIEITRVSFTPEPQTASGVVAVLRFSAGTMEIHCPKVAWRIASSLLGGQTS